MLQYKKLSANYDYLAPDTSEIRLLPATSQGGCAHCLLPPGKASHAVKHKTVEEIWYVISGTGEMWQKSDEQECINKLDAGTSITIPTGNHFQFRNTGIEPLCILIVTMPPWPGKEEAIPVDGYWK